MRAVLQRVSQASVTVASETVGRIDAGWLVLLGVGESDSLDDVTYLADKVLGLRAFPDTAGKMNLSVADISGSLLIVSQFTLYADCRKGRRPSFADAAAPERANELYEAFVAHLKTSGLTVATGRFQHHMEVALVNDGPVTFLLDSSSKH